MAKRRSDKVVKRTIGARKEIPFPFVAFAGHDAAKTALLLLAVEPRLRGALIEDERGGALSDLVRSFSNLLRSYGWEGQFIEVPLHVSEENLLGGLDFDRALKSGERRVRPSLLTRADGGALFVREIDLLEECAARYIASALDEGRVILEREGVSAILPADFILLATSTSSDSVYAGLLERIGLRVEAAGPLSPEDHELMLERALAFERDPRRFTALFREETNELISSIRRARRLLPEIEMSRKLQIDLLNVARSLGVEGHRADIFARDAARASAALAGRASVEREDLLLAIRLTLLPRAAHLPETAAPSPNTDAAQDESGDSNAERAPRESSGFDESERRIEEILVEAMDAFLPPGWLPLASREAAGKSSGRRGHTTSATRGRHRRSTSRRPQEGRIAFGATLRAAAPHQAHRQAGREESRFVLRMEDLRFKEFKRRAGLLFVFAVDASGSMAVNRMAQAKGATLRLLQQAYLHRDKVALVSFRGREAKVLLPPTRSVELARRLVDALPAGGATPLGAGLKRALELARLARLRDLSEAIVVTLTDGRANVPIDEAAGRNREERREAVQEELRRIGAAYQREAVGAVIVDTRFRFLANDEARALAEAVGGRYVYLPRADADSLKEAVNEFAARRRKRRPAGGA